MSTSYSSPEANLYYPNAAAGPSSLRRQSSNNFNSNGARNFDQANQGTILEEPDRGRFDDAPEEDTSYRNGGTGFRTMSGDTNPTYSYLPKVNEGPVPPRPGPPNPLRNMSSTSSSSLSGYYTSNNQVASDGMLSPNRSTQTQPQTPPRDRLISSSSISSMSSTLRGNRAPAPAALDLSPRTERQTREKLGPVQEVKYGNLGLGASPSRPAADSRRMASESQVDSSSRRASRPLPAPPQQRSVTTNPNGPPSAYQSLKDSFLRATTQPAETPDDRPAVPLSAVGVGAGSRPHISERQSSTASYASSRTDGDWSRPSIDSYYTSAAPVSPSYGNTLTTPVMQSFATSPISPDPVDPSNIDRKGLVGVGELSTPRWASNSGRQHSHMRTPSMPHDFGSSSTSTPYSGVPSVPSRDWAQTQNGYGLGFGVNENDRSKSSFSASALSAPGQETTGQRPPISQQTSSSSLLDFDFDSSMVAALAASLSISEDRVPTPPTRSSKEQYRASAPPAQSHPSAGSSSSTLQEWRQNAYLDSSTRDMEQRQPLQPEQLQQSARILEANAPNVSPGSARSRIYARRLSKQAVQLASQSPAQYTQTMEPGNIPPRTSSKQSPPTSADSSIYSSSSLRQRSDSRKTPPGRTELSTPKSRHSPGASSHAHHDIIKHFAPKDFSHLPPSPSSASINQFLRGSGSMNNFSSAGASMSTPPGSLPQSSSYFSGSSAASSKGGATVQRANSGTAKSINSDRRSGRDLDPTTAEALRKLDGLGHSTPGKTRQPKSKSSMGAISVNSRPGTPPGKTAKSGPASGDKSSFKADGSPLSNWVDLAEDLPSMPPSASNTSSLRGRTQKAMTGLGIGDLGLGTTGSAEKRASSSSTSYGTPTSRDSHSLPTAATTPSSAVPSKTGESSWRRTSGGSEMSTHSDLLAATDSASDAQPAFVPPVPPLPRGYQSMRQGLASAAGGSPAIGTTSLPGTGPGTVPPSYVPLRDEAPEAAPPSATTTPEVHSPVSNPDTSQTRPRTMNKKWSFSSALNLRLNSSSKEKESSASPASSPPVEKSSEAAWSEINRSDLPSPSLALPPTLNRYDSSQSTHSGGSSSAYHDAKSNYTVTPVGSVASGNNLAIPKNQTAPTKKSTPSSIPFFRRASSSSMASKSSSQNENRPPPQTPQTATQATTNASTRQRTTSTSEGQAAHTGSVRKSVLGMSFPSMLRGSSSKRVVSQQPPEKEKEKVVEIGKEPVQSASMGWNGRKRGKTLSISGDLAPKILTTPSKFHEESFAGEHSPTSLQTPTAPSLRPRGSENSLDQRSSAQSSRTESTIHGNGAFNALPPIAGSPGGPALRHPSSTSSLRPTGPAALPLTTPTKIPRMVARPITQSASVSTFTAPQSGRSSPNRGSMPPPSAPMTSGSSSSRPAKSMSTASSMVDIGRTGISEFGSVNGSYNTPRQTTTSGSHRAHLLAPMSARQETKRGQVDKVREPLVRQASGGGVVPPSRRHLPLPPPNSSVTAPTASSIAKRASREFRPSISTRNSGSGSGSGSRQQSPQDQGKNGTSSVIKPSKSLHSKLTIPSAVPLANTSTGMSNSASRLPTSSSMGSAIALKSRSTLIPESPTSARGSPDVQDDEQLADAEMEAYIKRRKMRAAAGKKEDLSDVNGFPEDILASEPISQRAFISKNLSKMSDFERKEVLDFDQIYYNPPHRIRRPAQPNGQIYNHGFDDERGDYIVVEGDHLCYRYEVIGVLGKGSFGQVLQCRDHKSGLSVAIKIIRNKKRFHAQALVEVKILGQLVEWDPEDKHHMVRMTEHFYFRGHLCIVTEMLSINLYELIKANQFNGFSTTLLRRFTVQMLSSLQLMRSQRIVHCDLKPENILLCHPSKSGIKVIDFGSSCHETEKVYTYIQSRFYRSPEVILGMNYAMAIDMWSLGCILAEMYTGVPIFPGENENEQLACIMEVLGLPDRHIVEKATRRKIFFDATGNPRPFVNAKGKRRRPNTKTLASVLKCDDELFVDFIARCLTWDPERRLKPQPALRHPWILAGRRRAGNNNVAAPRGANQSSLSKATGGGFAMFKNGTTQSGTSSGNSKQLQISPPTPLMARTTAHHSMSGNGIASASASASASALKLGGVRVARGGSNYA